MEGKTFIEQLKEMTAIFPIFGAYCVLYGAIDLITYYEEFDVTIMNYISFTEIITYFIRDVYVVILYGFVIFIMIRLSPTIVRQKQREIAQAEQIEGGLEKYKRRKRITLAFFMIPLVIASGFLIYRGNYVMTFLILMPPIASLVLANTVQDAKVFVFIFMSFILLISAYASSSSRAKKVKSGANHGYRFILDGQQIESDSSEYYIGQTEKFLLYYKSRDRRTYLFPIDRVEMVSIPEKGDTP